MSSLTIGKILGDFFLFIMFVVISRAFGQEGLGQYSFAIALTGFFMVLADFGLEYLSIKELSRHSDAVGAYYGGIFLLRLLLSLIATLLLLLLVAFLPLSNDAKIIIILVGVYQFAYKLMDGFAAIFMAREEMHTAALLTSSLRIVAALLAVVVILAGGSLIIALAMLPLVGVVQVFVGYGFVHRYHGPLQLSFSWSYLNDTLRRSLPFAITEFLRQISTRTDVVLLGFMAGAAAAGIYNGAYRIIFLLQFLPFFGAMSLFPLASKLYVQARDESIALYHKSLNASVLLGIPASFGLWLIAPQLILLIFGTEFVESIDVLRWLAWMVFLFCLKFIMQIFLMACDHQNEMMRRQWIAAVVGVILMAVLIFLHGPEGAAIAVLCAEVLLVLLYAHALVPLLGWPQIGIRLLISSVAAAGFGLPLLVVPSISLVLFIPLAAVIYTGALLLFREIRTNEFQTIVGLLKR